MIPVCAAPREVFRSETGPALVLEGDLFIGGYSSPETAVACAVRGFLVEDEYTYLRPRFDALADGTYVAHGNLMGAYVRLRPRVAHSLIFLQISNSENEPIVLDPFGSKRNLENETRIVTPDMAGKTGGVMFTVLPGEVWELVLPIDGAVQFSFTPDVTVAEPCLQGVDLGGLDLRP